MGTIWAGTTAGWKSGVPSIRTTTGWKPANYVWRFNGTSWVQAWQRDTTPPAKPTLALSIVSGTKKSINVAVTSPSEATVRTVVKVTTGNTWPSSPTTADGYYSQLTSNVEWSEFFKGQTVTSASQTKQFPSTAMSGVDLGYSTKVNVTAWTQDAFFNWSAPATATITTLANDPPPKVLTNFNGYVNAASSGTYRFALYYNWKSDNNYVYQAGSENNVGLWFYGTAIQTLLSGANSLLTAQLYVQRANTTHGVSGGANVMIGIHGYTARPSGAPSVVGVGNYGTLTRGEGKWFTISSSLVNFPAFVGGGNRGFGLAYTTTSYSSAYYMYAYGAGTTSGRALFTWNKYV